LYTSSFFLTESQVSLAASISSPDKSIGKLAPFFFLAASKSHLAARKSCLVGLTS
jgi:hypothetical protein